MQTTCNCTQCELKTIFFDSFKGEDYDIYCQQKIETNYAKGDVIIKEGEPIKEFLYLKSGLVKLYKSTSLEKDQIITIAKPFDFVSLLSIFSNENYNYSVMAIEDSVICSMDLEFLKASLVENPLLSSNMLKKMSAVFDMILIESLELRERNLRGKIAYFLLRLSSKIYYNTTFELPVSRREIAEYVGATTENVIRTFSELRKDKIIRINGKEIEIIDTETMEKISRFG